jgi:hypothetical protein
VGNSSYTTFLRWIALPTSATSQICKKGRNYTNARGLKYRGIGKGAHLLSSPNENSRIQITNNKILKTLHLEKCT